MTSDPESDPESERRIRALLAELGSAADADLRMPAEVADRLDATLAGLAAEHAAAHLADEHRATGTVVPLGPRWLPRVAAAAAAVIVLGLGGFAVGNLARNDAGSRQSSADGAAGARAARSPEPSGGGVPEAASAGGVPRMRVATFRADARAYLSRAGTDGSTSGGTTGSQAPQPSPQARRSSPGVAAARQDAQAAGCARPAVSGAARLTPLVLDGEPATLAVRRAARGTRLVEAWSCDGTARLASARVPARD